MSILVSLWKSSSFGHKAGLRFWGNIKIVAKLDRVPTLRRDDGFPHHANPFVPKAFGQSFFGVGDAVPNQGKRCREVFRLKGTWIFGLAIAHLQVPRSVGVALLGGMPQVANHLLTWQRTSR